MPRYVPRSVPKRCPLTNLGVAVLRANIQEPADVPPIPFSWQTAIWKQHRLSASIIDCSDFRFAILNSSLEHQLRHLYDYRALPFLILQIYIEELLGNVGRAKRSEYRIEPPPTMTEKFTHHISLKRQCLACIPFLCWLIDFDVLTETAFACEPCLRSCFLHELPIIQATLICADQDLNHLNQLLQFHLCCEHPRPPPPLPPTAKPPTPKPPPPPQPLHHSCCAHCTKANHTSQLLFILLVPLAVILTLVILYIRNNWTSRWLTYLLVSTLICQLLIRHSIRSSLDSIRETTSAYVSETKKAIIAALILLAGV